jgi:hypothetical protein
LQREGVACASQERSGSDLRPSARQSARGKFSGSGFNPVFGALPAHPFNQITDTILELDPRLVSQQSLREFVSSPTQPFCTERLTSVSATAARNHAVSVS